MTLALKLLATAFVALALIHADQPAGGFFAGAFITCLLFFFISCIVGTARDLYKWAVRARLWSAKRSPSEHVQEQGPDGIERANCGAVAFDAALEAYLMVTCRFITASILLTPRLLAVHRRNGQTGFESSGPASPRCQEAALPRRDERATLGPVLVVPLGSYRTLSSKKRVGCGAQNNGHKRRH